MDSSLLHRKERIIISTIEALDELGIQGVSTREIARRQEISEGTIFKHFKSKNELLLAVLNHYSQYDLDIMESVKLKSLKPSEAIMYAIEAYAEFYENYPAIISVMQASDALRGSAGLEDKVKDIFFKRINFIKGLVIEAQKNGEIRSKIDSEEIADIINGAFRTICLKWKYSKHEFQLKQYTLLTVKLILDSLKIC